MNGFKRQVTSNFRTNVPANVPQNMFTEPGSHLEGCEDLLESLTFAKSFLKLFGAVRLWSVGIHQGRPEHGDINRLHIVLSKAPHWCTPRRKLHSSFLRAARIPHPIFSPETWLIKIPVEVNGAITKLKTSTSARKSVLELCNSPHFAKYYWDWVTVLPSTAAWSENPHTFTCLSVTAISIKLFHTQKGNLFLMLDSGSDWGFSHKEFIISEIQLAK